MKDDTNLKKFSLFASGIVIGSLITFWLVHNDFQVQAVRAGHAYWSVNDAGETTFTWKPIFK